MSDHFTPEQIAQILEEFFKVVGTRQYIGARYVPLFGRKDEDSIEWDNTAPYEPLTIVLYQGNSYTSRQYVPVGVEITNQEFWAITGNYNAQVEQYRREVFALDARVTANTENIAAEETAREDADTALGAQITAETTAREDADTAETTARTEADEALGQLITETQNTADNSARLDTYQTYGNMICEFPWLGFVFDSTTGVQGAAYYENDGNEHVVVAHESSYNGPFYIVDFDLTNDTATNHDVSSIFADIPGSLNSMCYDSENNELLVLYNNSIIRLDTTNFNQISRHALTGITNTIYGIDFSSDGTLWCNTTTLAQNKLNINYYKVDSSYACTLYDSVEVITNQTLYQAFCIMENDVIAHIGNNSLLFYDIESKSVMGFSPSKLRYAEYEDGFFYNGSLCLSVNVPNAKSVSVMQTNIGSDGFYSFAPTIQVFTANHVYVDESATTIFERGNSRLPMHSGSLAMALAYAYGPTDLFLISDCTDVLQVNNAVFSISGDNTGRPKATIKGYNSIIAINGITLNSSELINTCYVRLSNVTVGDLLEVNSSNVNIITQIENAYAAKFQYCKFVGSIYNKVNSASLFESPTGINGSFASISNITTEQWSDFTTNGPFVAEIGPTQNSEPTGLVVLSQLRQHPGQLYGGGCVPTGYAYVNINGSLVANCTINGNTAYVYRVYAL